MSFLSSILPAIGAIGGSFFGPVGTAIGGSLGAGIGGSISSNDAAGQQQQGAQNAINTQLQMFQQNQQNLAPWLQSGQTGNAELMRLLGIGGNAQNPTFDPNAMLVRPFGMSDFQADPGYQFRLQQGLGAIENTASARGGIAGGNALKSLTDYAQGLASTEYNNAYNRYNQNINNIYGRLSGLSNTGANVAGQVAGLGANTASNVSSLQNQIGATNAAGVLGGQNALSSGIGGGINNWLLANAMQQGNGGFGGGLLNSLSAFQPGGFSDPQAAIDTSAFFGF